jgi:hypothetical protein
MQSQESMFEQPEPTPVQPINTDPREQRQRQEVPPAEGNGETYHEYSEGYGGEEYSEGYNREEYSEGYHTPYSEPWLTEGEKLRPRQRPAAAFKNSSARPLAVLLLIVALLIGWSGISHARFDGWQRGWPEHSHGHFHDGQGAIPAAQNFFVTGAPTLVVNAGSGSVHIHTGDTGRVLVATSDGPPVQTQQDDNIIDVGSGSTSASLLDNNQDLDITVPVASNLEIRTGSGDVSIEGVSGQITLSTDSGDVELQHTLLQGESSITSNDSKITVQGGLDLQGSYQFQTGSGDVELTLPQDSAFHLIPSTTSGSIENGFEGRPGNNSSGPLLKINTDSGDITVQPQDD